MKPWNEEQAMDHQWRDFTHPATTPRSVNGGSKTRHEGVRAAYRHLIAKEPSFEAPDRKLELARTPPAKEDEERGAVCVTAREVDGRQHRERERLEAGDRERERLGRELHDGLCQNLAGITALSATLARKLAARDDPSQAAAAEITALLQQAIGDARDLARGLSARGLAQMGLAAALEALAANFEALHPVRCAFACDPHFPRLDPTVEAHLYRIAQEAVRNSVAHGRGSRISVSLRLRDGQASLRIRDNGVGIPRGAVGAPRAAGTGLDTMHDRARLILARLQVRRAAPCGTLVACTFPLPPPAAKERRRAGNRP
jgi:signal transduction histidine kinase